MFDSLLHPVKTIKTGVTPLGGEYCDFFYYLSMINLLLVLYIVLSAIYLAVFDKKKEGVFHIVLVAMPTFLSYFTNRLLYSMCVGSTQK
jgi:asparagine N-glycosylation enzyme membrane subunit Stt3